MTTWNQIVYSIISKNFTNNIFTLQEVYEPCCGSGGMFVQSAKFIEEHQGKIGDISVYGQESIPTTWRLAKMNLAIRGIDGNLGMKNGDTFTHDQHKNLKADFILANPPDDVSNPNNYDN